MMRSKGSKFRNIRNIMKKTPCATPIATIHDGESCVTPDGKMPNIIHIQTVAKKEPMIPLTAPQIVWPQVKLKVKMKKIATPPVNQPESLIESTTELVPRSTMKDSGWFTGGVAIF